MSKLKEIVFSRSFHLILYGIAGAIFVFLVFGAGVGVGLHKAKYSFQWGENYERNFMGGRPMVPKPQWDRQPAGMGMMRGLDGKDFRNGHGFAGMVISVADNTIIVKDYDGKENTITTNEKTIIKDKNEDVKNTDLKTDQRIVVFGKPGDGGSIDADFIRVFDNFQK